MKEFEAKWGKKIVLNHTGDLGKKVSFIQNLYDKTGEKINHFDKLRQQHLNYALVSFSGLSVFVMSAQNTQIKSVVSVGIIFLMGIFLYIDQRLHKYTHGFSSSQLIFTQAIGYLLNNPREEIAFYQYYAPAEKKARLLESSIQNIYFFLILAGIVLFGWAVNYMLWALISTGIIFIVWLIVIHKIYKKK